MYDLMHPRVYVSIHKLISFVQFCFLCFYLVNQEIILLIIIMILLLLAYIT